MKPYLIALAVIVAAIAIPAAMAHKEKAREAEAGRLVNLIQDAAYRAEEERAAIERGHAGAETRYRLALESLEKLQRDALAAGAREDVVKRHRESGTLSSWIKQDEQRAAEKKEGGPR